MKMLFFTSDAAEAEAARKELAEAGIPCETRTSPMAEGVPPNPACEELWIQDDTDSYRATMRCVALGLGFSRRPAKISPTDELEEDLPAAWAA